MNLIDGKAFLAIISLFVLAIWGIYKLADRTILPHTIEVNKPLKFDVKITVENGKADTLYIYHLLR